MLIRIMCKTKCIPKCGFTQLDQTLVLGGSFTPRPHWGG